MACVTLNGFHDERPSIHRIAIVGGGPTGIACAKYLISEQVFDTIDIFEQRNNVGGIWNLSGNKQSRNIPVPQTSPNFGCGSGHDNQNRQGLEFESPLYDYLETNIPKRLMAYSDLPFDQDLPLFPKHLDVLKYLENYAKHVKHLIRFNTQVLDINPQFSPKQASSTSRLSQKWDVVTKDLRTGAIHENQYDAVIVANGHYTVPHIPEINGLAEWHKKYPDTIVHSKAYRRPEDFRGRKVLVIGNSASGLDIAAQLAPFTKQPVYLASRSASQLAPTGKGPSWRKDVAEIETFIVDDDARAVRSRSGEIIEGLDAVIFATGYFYSFPSLIQNRTHSNSQSQSPSESSTSVDSSGEDNPSDHYSNQSQSSENKHQSKSLVDLTTSGLRTHHMYKHLLHMYQPTLALPVLNLKVIPFPLAENQAAVIARIWSGRLELPSLESMEKWEQNEEKRLISENRVRPFPMTAFGDSVGTANDTGNSKAVQYEGGFHTLVYPEDAKQINSLHEWASSAKKRDGLENGGNGKLGTRWNEEMVWLRGQFPNIKAAYAGHGENRTEVTDLDMLGDDWINGFEKWRRKTDEEEQRRLFQNAGVSGW